MTFRESKSDFWATDYLAMGHVMALFNSDYEDWGDARIFGVSVNNKWELYGIQMGAKPVQGFEITCANEQKIVSDNNYKKYLCQSLCTIDLGMSQRDIEQLVKFIQTESIESYSKITHQIYDYVLKKADLRKVCQNINEFMQKDFQRHDSNYNDVEGFTKHLEDDVTRSRQQRNEINIETTLNEADNCADCSVDLDEVEVNG